MCELFGMSSASPIGIQEYLRTFFSHSVKHPHGWGLMRTVNGCTDIIKEPVCATGSRILNGIINKTEPQTLALAHIRLATVGIMKQANCHPYSGFDASGRRWTLIHNGTIYSGTQLYKYLPDQTGDTDSERIFLYLMEEINKAIILNDAPLSELQRCSILNRIAVALSPRNKLNLIVSDGELLYVHKNMRHTLFYMQTENGILFSTQPLTDGVWEKYPLTQLNAFKNGKCVYKGTQHGHEFIPTMEYVQSFYAMNI